MNHNILFITPALNKAGAETQLVKLASYMEAEKNKVWILSLLPKPECDIAVDNPAIKVLFLDNWRTHFSSNIFKLKAIMEEVKPDLVIAFMFIAIIFARLLKTVYDFTLISSIRAGRMPIKWYLPFKITSGLDDMVVYNAVVTKRYFERHSLARKRGLVINNAISVPGTTNSQKNGVPSRNFQWICVAHFRPVKDYHTLFKAIALIKDKPFKVTIIGNLFGQTWPLESIKKLQIEDKVEILGYRQNTAAYMRKADALVLSSFSESMPNAVLEAMANEKPVVASAVGAIPGLLQASGCGFCFKQGDEKQLAALMRRVMEMSPTERDALASKGRGYVEAHFSHDRVMRRWLNIISDHINNKCRV